MFESNLAPDLENGDLLDAAERLEFDVLLTCDKNLQYQQNMAGRQIAVAILGSDVFPIIKKDAGHIMAMIAGVGRGGFVFIELPQPPKRLRKGRRG